MIRFCNRIFHIVIFLLNRRSILAEIFFWYFVKYSDSCHLGRETSLGTNLGENKQ